MSTAAAAGRVAVVTDSTSYLPAGLLPADAVTVVPVQVVIAGRAYDEGTEVSPAQVAAALREWQVVTTSRPAPERLAQAYECAAQSGATGIVSIHLSAQMSGTYESALLAARRSPVPTRVIDSGSVGMGAGFGVIAAARAASDGAGLDAVARAARERCAASYSLFYVDTLDYLRRGGRVGAAQAMLGQALAVKPILTIVEGQVRLLEKVRTASRALARIQELVVARVADGEADLAVHHLDARERAETVAERLTAALPGAQVVVSEVGAVVGAHVGPGMIAVVVSPH